MPDGKPSNGMFSPEKSMTLEVEHMTFKIPEVLF